MGIRHALIRLLRAEPNYTRLIHEAGGDQLKWALNYKHETDDYDRDEHPERVVLSSGAWLPGGKLLYLIVNLDEPLGYGVRETVYELYVLPGVSWDLVDGMAARLETRLPDNWYVRVRLQDPDGRDMHEAMGVGTGKAVTLR